MLMYVPPGLGLVKQCTVVVHEFGHWMGLGHSPDPHDVMYAELVESSVPGACWHLWTLAYPGRTVAQAHHWFRWTVTLGGGEI
jgi:matrixin